MSAIRTDAPLLKAIKKGQTRIVSREEIYRFNSPNYPIEDILIQEMAMDIKPYNEQEKYNEVHCNGKCVDLSHLARTGGNFPELQWEHMSVTLLAVIITQAGKTSHNVCCAERNGVALRSLHMDFRRQVTTNLIHFKYDSKIYQRKDEVWADSEWRFYTAESESLKKFANFKIVSRGVSRDYGGVEAAMSKKMARLKKEVAVDLTERRIGVRLINSGIITEWQRDHLLKIQEKSTPKVRFGDLAIKMGYCDQDILRKHSNS